jgi:hypothetical protein
MASLAQGSTFDGPLQIRDGGLKLADSYRASSRVVEIKQFSRTITSAEILALFGTPIEVAEAPGAGKINVFKGASIALDATATAYAGVGATEDLAIRYTNASGAIVSTTLEATGFIDQTTDQVRTIKEIVTDVTPVVNAALVLHMLNGEVTTGTGVLHINVVVEVHETGL